MTEEQPRIKCKCGENSDGWPDDLCQMCWEKYCDEAFWAQLTGGEHD